MAKSTKSEILEALKEYGVLTKKDMPDIFKEHGVATQRDLNRLERSLTIKITKSKNDLADRIANLGLNKAQATRVDKIEKRVKDIETFIYV